MHQVCSDCVTCRQLIRPIIQIRKASHKKKQSFSFQKAVLFDKKAAVNLKLNQVSFYKDKGRLCEEKRSKKEQK